MEVVFTMEADSHVLTVGWPQADGALSARRRWILDDATVVLIYHPLSHVIDRLLPEDDEGSVGICHGITRGITHFRAFTGPAFSWSLGIDRQRKSFLSPPLWPISLLSAAATQQIESGFARQTHIGQWRCGR